MSTAQTIFDNAFPPTRETRSPEYRQGVLDILMYRLGEKNTGFVAGRYLSGTAAADAYYAGCDEGHYLAHEHLKKTRHG